jgi:hypothetical protein
VFANEPFNGFIETVGQKSLIEINESAKKAHTQQSMRPC